MHDSTMSCLLQCQVSSYHVHNGVIMASFACAPGTFLSVHARHVMSELVLRVRVHTAGAGAQACSNSCHPGPVSRLDCFRPFRYGRCIDNTHVPAPHPMSASHACLFSARCVSDAMLLFVHNLPSLWLADCPYIRLNCMLPTGNATVLHSKHILLSKHSISCMTGHPFGMKF